MGANDFALTLWTPPVFVVDLVVCIAVVHLNDAL